MGEREKDVIAAESLFSAWAKGKRSQRKQHVYGHFANVPGSWVMYSDTGSRRTSQTVRINGELSQSLWIILLGFGGCLFDCPTLKNQLTSAKFCLHNYMGDCCCENQSNGRLFPLRNFHIFLFHFFIALVLLKEFLRRDLKCNLSVYKFRGPSRDSVIFHLSINFASDVYLKIL